MGRPHRRSATATKRHLTVANKQSTRVFHTNLPIVNWAGLFSFYGSCTRGGCDSRRAKFVDTLRLPSCLSEIWFDLDPMSLCVGATIPLSDGLASVAIRGTVCSRRRARWSEVLLRTPRGPLSSVRYLSLKIKFGVVILPLNHGFSSCPA